MKEFISKWSNLWRLTSKREQLDDAFEKELNELIEREVALRIQNVVGLGEQLAETTTKPIKSNEVRIGNLVQDRNGVIMRVVSIHEDGPVYCDFEGNKEGMWEFNDKYPCYAIPLTGEILLKMGFEKTEGSDHKVCYEFKDRDDRNYYIYFNRGVIALGFIAFGNCTNLFYDDENLQYAHQLQNIFFALTGEELVIK